MSNSLSVISRHNVDAIIRHLKNERGLDFSGNRTDMLERRIQKRLFSTQCIDLDDYLRYLNLNKDELDKLIDVLTINVSHFFRNSLSFEYLRKEVLPTLLNKKLRTKDTSIRVWSAGCSFGEEAYTTAIIINEFLKKEERLFTLNVFATDIDKNALKAATKGLYTYKSVKNVKYHLLKKYFTIEGEHFKIDSELQKKVQFSFYDLLDKKRTVPPESIYGSFDLVLCRNVMIYFDLKYQSIIFEKLYHSLKPGGYLVLGEAEFPTEKIRSKFIRENKACKIFRKIN